MHIHPPKPLHGWKEFLNEIFVIVVGVLIALGLEQVVEWAHWKHKVAEGEELLASEAVRNIGTSAEFYAVAPCIDAQVEAIRRNLAEGASRKALPRNDLRVERTVVVTPQRATYTAIWQGLGSDGTLNHMASERYNAWSSLFEAAGKQGQVGLAAFDLSQEFDVLAEPVVIDPAASFSLLARVDKYQQMMAMLHRAGMRNFQYYRNLGLELPEKRIDDFLAQSRTIQFCKTHGLPVDDWRGAISEKLNPMSL